MNFKIKRLNIFLSLFFVIAVNNVAIAQIFEGVVKNETGDNIEHVSIFISELSQGFSTNEAGKFSAKIEKGTYTCVFRHLSYQTQTVVIDIPQPQPAIIVMKPKIYDIDEAIIKQNAENPAYSMMRQVIARAPYYKNQVSEYKSTTYLRGTFKIDKISNLIKKFNKKTLNENDINEGDAYIQESINEIEYKDGKITQRITAIKDNFPKIAEIDISGLWLMNIYNLDNEMFITPLAPNAFTYYKFTYDGFFTEDDRVINKITIIPRREDNRLVSGYIYVFENSWDVHSFDISGKQEMLEYSIKQIFGEVLKNIMMPIRSQISATFSVFGNKGEVNGVSSIKYSDLKANSTNLVDRLDENSSSKKQTERQQTIKSLIEKQDFTNADAAKVKRALEKFEHEKIRETADRKIGKYEIVQNFNVEKDSAARNFDNLYWDSIRTIPMLDYEVQSYKRSDSLALMRPEKPQKKSSLFKKIIFGSEHKIDNSQLFEYSGVVNISANFNAVDIFNYGQKISYRKKFKNETRFMSSAEAAYSFGRRKLLTNTKLRYYYFPEARAVLFVNYSDKTVDFNENSGINGTSNALSSVLFKKNYINFYGKQLVQIGNSIDVVDGLRFTFDVSYQKRKQLHNNTNFSFFGRNKQYRSNNPVNPYIEQDSSLIQTSRAFTINAQLSYTPCQYYTRKGRVKTVVYSNYPTFSLNYRTGINGIFNSVSNFSLLSVEISQNIPLDILNNISYTAKAGKFLTTKQMHFSEFAHFNLSEDDWMFSPFDGTRKIMQTYYSSTNEWFLQFNFSYSTSRLLIKRVIFPRSNFNENLYFSYLHTPYLKHFSEVGYGLSNIFRIVGAGVFLGFEDLQHKFVRVKLSIGLGD